jgi:hypothetical protein
VRNEIGDWDLPADADELTYLLYWQCDVISHRQAVRLLTRETLRHRVASRRWQRLQRGIYCAHNGPLTPAQRMWAAALASGAGEPGLLGGRSALQLLGLRGFAPDRIHVLAPARRRDKDLPDGVVQHRASVLPPHHVMAHGRPPSTTAARSTVDAASWAQSDREAMTVVAMAFQQRLVTLDEIRAVLTALPRAKRRRLTWTTATDAAGGAESLGELDVARLLRTAHLPEPTRQQLRVDAGGTWTSTSDSGVCTSKSTVPTTSIRLRPGSTPIGRTNCGSPASASSGSRRGSFASTPTRSPPTSAAPSSRPAGRADLDLGPARG